MAQIDLLFNSTEVSVIICIVWSDSVMAKVTLATGTNMLFWDQLTGSVSQTSSSSITVKDGPTQNIFTGNFTNISASGGVYNVEGRVTGYEQTTFGDVQFKFENIRVSGAALEAVLNTRDVETIQNFMFKVLEGDDRVIGSSTGDWILGWHGNDRLFGNGGSDYIFGGTGQDFISGGAGSDIIYSDIGADEIYGGIGNDSIGGGGGNDIISGGLGKDSIDGGGGRDKIYGNDGVDWIDGGNGYDRLEGNNGSDWLFGEEGNDVLVGGIGNDNLFGGDGYDRIYGGAGGDTLEGGYGTDLLVGGGGADMFLFSWYSDNDYIRDFEKGVDTIYMTGVLVDHYIVFEDLTITYSGGDAKIGYFTNTLTVENVSNLTASDFEFN